MRKQAIGSSPLPQIRLMAASSLRTLGSVCRPMLGEIAAPVAATAVSGPGIHTPTAAAVAQGRYAALTEERRAAA